jgi:hypothetical protein
MLRIAYADAGELPFVIQPSRTLHGAPSLSFFLFVSPDLSRRSTSKLYLAAGQGRRSSRLLRRWSAMGELPISVSQHHVPSSHARPMARRSTIKAQGATPCLHRLRPPASQTSRVLLCLFPPRLLNKLARIYHMRLEGYN